MHFDYDVAVIGLGPAGMAVSVMASRIGLRVLGVEQRSLGGECTSAGCIPSKALLRMAHVRHTVGRLADFALATVDVPRPTDPFARIAEHLHLIGEQKTTKLLEKVDLKLGEGPAAFLDPHRLSVGEVEYTAKKIFVCTGTQPAIPAIPGLDSIETLTGETVFGLDGIPESLLVLGGGATGCEMAQAFRRLGARVSIVHMDRHLLPHGDWEAGELLEGVFADEGISVYNERTIQRAWEEGGAVALRTNRNETLWGARLLVCAGRTRDLSKLNLEAARVAYTEGGIRVDRTLRTTSRHVYAPGDCNGHHLSAHAAMHQGMVALANATAPWPLRMNFRKYVVPWTVFTDPPIAHVGWLERDLRENDVPYEAIEARYEDYGAAIAEGAAVGSVKAFVSETGRIYGVRIVGEGATEMINEWGLAIQNRLRIHRIMLLQHSFPSMSFLSKRAAEGWMMRRLESPFLRRIVRLLF